MTGVVPRTELRLVPSIGLVVAGVASVVFLLAGFLVPGNEDSGGSSDWSVITQTSSTVVSENGSWVVLLLVFPLLATIGVAIALGRSDRPTAIVIAWSLTGTVALLNLLAMVTVGIFLVPVTVALLVACAHVTVKRPAQP